MHMFLKAIYKIQHACVYISAFLMAILAISIFYDVVARYIFNSPTIWANEVSMYILQFIVFFTMGCIQMEGRQMRVTFLIERLKGTPRKILEALSSILILPYSIVLVVYGFQFTQNAFRLGMGSPTLLEIPLWIPYSFICSGGGLLVIAAVCSVIKAWMPEQLKTEGGV